MVDLDNPDEPPYLWRGGRKAYWVDMELYFTDGTYTEMTVEVEALGTEVDPDGSVQKHEAATVTPPQLKNKTKKAKLRLTDIALLDKDTCRLFFEVIEVYG